MRLQKERGDVSTFPSAHFSEHGEGQGWDKEGMGRKAVVRRSLKISPRTPGESPDPRLGTTALEHPGRLTAPLHRHQGHDCNNPNGMPNGENIFIFAKNKH